jgi:MFS family permease
MNHTTSSRVSLQTPGANLDDDDDDESANYTLDELPDDESQVWSVGSNVISSYVSSSSSSSSAKATPVLPNADAVAASSIWRPYWNLLAYNPHYRILWTGSTLSRMSDAISYITVVCVSQHITHCTLYTAMQCSMPCHRTRLLGLILILILVAVMYAVGLVVQLTLLNQLSSSGLLLSLFLLTRMLPRMLLGPILGVLVDRLDRRAFMFSCDLIRAMLVLFNLFATSERTIWVLFVVSTLQFCLAALFEPCRASLVPNTVSPAEILTANTFDGTMWSLTLAAAASIGGILINTYGTSIGFMVNSVTYFLSSMCTVPLMLDPTLSIEGLKYRSAVRQRKPDESAMHEYKHTIFDMNHDQPVDGDGDDGDDGDGKQRDERSTSRRLQELAQQPCTSRSHSAHDQSIAQRRDRSSSSLSDDTSWHRTEDELLTSQWVLVKATSTRTPIPMHASPQPPIINVHHRLPTSNTDKHANVSINESDNLLSGAAGSPPAKARKRIMLLEGFRFIWYNPYVLALIYIKASSMFVVGGTTTLNIWITENTYDSDSDDDGSLLGFLQTILGLASLLGPLIARRFGRQTAIGVATTIILAWAMLTVATALTAIPLNLWVFLSLTAFQAAGASILWVYSASMMQKFAVDHYRGRILGIDLANTTLMQATGNIVVGILLEFGLKANIVCGLLAVVALVLSLLWSLYFWVYYANYDRPIIDPQTLLAEEEAALVVSHS